MPLWMQNLMVVLLVAGCLAFVVWQTLASVRGKRSKLGSCCAKGCQPAEQKPVANQKAERIVFLPVEMLGKRK